MLSMMPRSTSPVATIIILQGLLAPASASVRCLSALDCESKVRQGSECIDGFCSNPYFKGGCLANNLKNHHRVRTCNSEDPPEAVEKGYCQPSSMGYTEVRIAAQNWESVFFEAWILQILLSEMLEVPVTVETGVADKNVDLYNRQARMGYGTSNDWDAMRTSHQIKDCRKLKESPDYLENYVPCFHVVPEVWTGHKENLDALKDDGIIEPPSGLGAIGGQGWYIPRFTAERDPTLLTYIGIQGEENRAKLAATFLRPTTWEDYCLYESISGCEVPDGVAVRPPKDEEENELYFAGDDFTGYFRNTTQNDCGDGNSKNCTGHIVDYPCGWSSFVGQQAHHLNIAVESNGKEPGSNGYSYAAMTQIWAAAHRTKSNVILHWWSPEALYQEFLNTDSEFSRISLPPPTQDCVENRVNPIDRCGDSFEERVGDALGACDEAPHALFKIIGSSLYDISYDSELPEAMHSPAYEAVKNFRISDLELGKVFDYWFEGDIDRWGIDPRDAACRWVLENFEQVEAFVPRSHPRLPEDNDHIYEEPLYYASLALACLALVGSGASTVTAYYQRNKDVLRFAQIEFLFLLLIGLVLVSIGSVLNVLPPSDKSCVAVAWFINLGYTLELVPLVVKVAALNRLMVAAQNMQRLQLKLYTLFGAVFLIALVVGLCLIVWTITDPPRKDSQVKLTDDITEYGETIVERSYYCTSGNQLWNYIAVSWQLFLLLTASVLAFQTRKLREDLNETRTLAMLIYSHFVFVMLRALSYIIDDSVSQTDLASSRSIIFSCDVLATIGIYFVPKFFFIGDSVLSRPWLKRRFATGQPAGREHQNEAISENGRPSVQAIVSAHRARYSLERETSENSTTEDDDDSHSKSRGNSFTRNISLRPSTIAKESAVLDVVSEEEEVGLDEDA